MSRPHPYDRDVRLAQAPWLVTGILTCLAALLLSGLLAAHEGPPFPILVDEVAEPWSLSVWADPDVGIGTFWVMLDPVAGRTLPDDTVVTVHVAPTDGRLPETSWIGEREARDEGETFVTDVEFPTREFWLVRIIVTSESAASSAERSVRVEVTPPGYGPIDLVLYLWPFLALGVLWFEALRRRRRALASEQATHPETPVQSHV